MSVFRGLLIRSYGSYIESGPACRTKKMNLHTN